MMDTRGQSVAKRARIPVWIAVMVVLGALLLLIGALASKVNPGSLAGGKPVTATTIAYANYTFARELALAIMLVLLLALRARRMLAGLMLLVALIQFIDLLDDLGRGDFALVPVVLVYAI